ncbi:hypothetical protein BGCPKDLD_1509 [Methylorubrum suomiense]|uniref:Uncharacterized protein n=1 Tax=Methylorubrum suomiense TaxID=144191 RepID=A0ABQ4UT99_9HYPH|nr:hypothetical protein BGCPKDLD_1509 [Methylorubrum suomiense]
MLPPRQPAVEDLPQGAGERAREALVQGKAGHSRRQHFEQCRAVTGVALAVRRVTARPPGQLELAHGEGPRVRRDDRGRDPLDGDRVAGDGPAAEKPFRPLGLRPRVRPV